MTKNTTVKITRENDRICLLFTNLEFQKIGWVDYEDGLWEIIHSSNWRIKDNYIYSRQRSLHTIVMEYWYGEECCQKMRQQDFVIDHIDNDGFNCLYENLAFLSRTKNWQYKGNYYDRERAKTIPLAPVNIFKKRGGEKFQITIGFNSPLTDENNQQFSAAFFVYDTNDYDLVLSDAVMLVESINKREINLKNLRYNHYKLEPFYFIEVDGPPPETGSLITRNGKTYIAHGTDTPVFHKIAPNHTIW